MCVVKEQGFEIVPNLFSRETISSLAESLENAAVLRSRAGIRSAIFDAESCTLDTLRLHHSLAAFN